MSIRILTVSYICERETMYPYIRLKGRWLQREAGFHCQDRISVQVAEPGVLVIRRIEGHKERSRYTHDLVTHTAVTVDLASSPSAPVCHCITVAEVEREAGKE